MSDTIITVVAIFLAAILMFVFPLITMSDKVDNVSQTSLQTAVSEFVEEVKNTGKITKDRYDKFEQSLPSQNTYKVELEVWKLDENPGKKTSQTNNTKIGENGYYKEYTQQVTDELYRGSGEYALKEGDIIKVKVTNTNQTMSSQVSALPDADISTLSAEASGTVVVNGN